MSGGKFDYREIEKLKKQLGEIEKATDTFCRDCANEIAARLLRKVKKRTPVWDVSKIDDAIYQKYWSGYKGGELRRSWTVGEIRKQGDVYEIEILNPKNYASYVEFGHRQQPGRFVPAIGKKLKTGWVPGKFMMTISEKELQSAVPGILRKKLEEFIRGALA